jgi:2-polyprenyl-3-methyl-5-hydroxy-6-metoxy-1,4-benzoquinol methylase
MERQWNDFHKSKETSGDTLEYPDEYVVRFLKRLRKDDNVKKVLDIPCGAGRHTALAAELGFDAFGGDISEEAVELTKRHLLKRKLKAELKILNLLDLQYDAELFDAVVSWRSFHVLSKEDMFKAISELKRVVRKDGHIIFSTRSDRNIYNKKQVGKIVQKPTELSLDELKKLCSTINVLQIELSESSSNNRAFRDSYWVVFAKHSI